MPTNWNVAWTFQWFMQCCKIETWPDQWAAILFKIFSKNIFLKFSNKFNIPQAKRDLISSMKNFIFELLQKSPNNIRYWESRKQGEYLKIARGHTLVSSLSSKNQFLTLVVKNYAKTDIKIMWFCINLLDFLNFAQSILNKIVSRNKFLFIIHLRVLQLSTFWYFL